MITLLSPLISSLFGFKKWGRLYTRNHLRHEKKGDAKRESGLMKPRGSSLRPTWNAAHLSRVWPRESGRGDGRRDRMESSDVTFMWPNFCPSLWKDPSVSLTGEIRVTLLVEVTWEKERTRSSFESHGTRNKALFSLARAGLGSVTSASFPSSHTPDSKPATWSELTKLLMNPKKLQENLESGSWLDLTIINMVARLANQVIHLLPLNKVVWWQNVTNADPALVLYGRCHVAFGRKKVYLSFLWDNKPKGLKLSWPWSYLFLPCREGITEKNDTNIEKSREQNQKKEKLKDIPSSLILLCLPMNF